MSGGKDGQPLFNRILPATTMGLTSTTAVDWHLKVKNKKCDVGLTENYCITVSIQKISSIHKFIQQILGSHELTDHTHFWPDPPKNHCNNFLLSWICICTTMQKISSFHRFVIEIQPIFESRDQTGHNHCWPHPSKNFWSTFNLCEFVSTCKISRCFIDLLWRYGWLKNPAIWLAEKILAHISGTRIFPNMGFVQEHSK